MYYDAYLLLRMAEERNKAARREAEQYRLNRAVRESRSGYKTQFGGVKRILAGLASLLTGWL